jgi:hypothetical protein
MERMFRLPLPNQAALQLESLEMIIQNANWDETVHDRWVYSWGTTKYSSRRVYRILIGDSPASPLFNWLWGSSNPGNHKFFFWLLLRDRLNTRNLLRRKNMFLEDYSCALCDLGCEETCFHLFFECPFSRDCWATIPITWNQHVNPLEMILQARSDFNNPIFREIFITACWLIWTTRNKVIFDHGQKNIQLWKRQLRDELDLVCAKAKTARSIKIHLWKDIFFVIAGFSLGLHALFFFVLEPSSFFSFVLIILLFNGNPKKI